MSTTFYAGNAKNLLIKEQTDKDTPVSDWTDALNLRIYEWAKQPVRALTELSESDSSTQQAGTHVSAITPGISFGVYGRPSELALICEALLGGVAVDVFTPDVVTKYYSIMEVIPYGDAIVYDGCRLAQAQFTGQDEGDTELRVTGLTWIVLGVTEGVTTPDPLPDVIDEVPFIWAEASVSYDTDHPGTTTAITWTVNRNTVRAQGDTGFRALDAVHGKFQADGSVTRYTADDATLRAIDTGTTGGTVPTTVVFTEPLEIVFERGADADHRLFRITGTEVSYETRDEALDLNGLPFKEVLGFRTQPQATLAENLEMQVTIGA